MIRKFLEGTSRPGVAGSRCDIIAWTRGAKYGLYHTGTAWWWTALHFFDVSISATLISWFNFQIPWANSQQSFALKHAIKSICRPCDLIVFQVDTECLSLLKSFSIFFQWGCRISRTSADDFSALYNTKQAHSSSVKSCHRKFANYRCYCWQK